MSSTQPVDPDALYCVYCHAVAAGSCATCGALCCADCVELAMGLTKQRAVCRSCVERGARPAERRLLGWMGAVAAGLIALVAAVLWLSSM